jgi:hypothetical protein
MLTERSMVHRLFMRALMLLALLICVATVHDDATHDHAGHVTATTASTSIAGPALPGEVPDDKLTAAVDGHAGGVGHHAHGSSCDAAFSGGWRTGTLASPEAISTPPATDAEGGLAATAVPPVVRPGRILLLHACVSRT